MKIKVDRSRSNRILVLCEGKLDIASSEELEKVVHAIIEGSDKSIVIDLARIKHITDYGVEALLRLFELSRQKHLSINQTEKIRISQMSQEVRDLLRMKGLLVSMTHLYSSNGENTDYVHYEDILNQVRHGFPTPVSDLAKDAYFKQAINQSLEKVNQLKSSNPYWGERRKLDIGLARNSKIPESMATLEGTIDGLCDYLQGTLNWGHPRVQKNVIPPTSTLSIIGHMLGSVANANLISDELSHRFAEAELEVVSMCAELIGYNQQQAGGFFTFGGTATNLYAVKLGIEKALPGAFKDGIRQDVKVLSSDVAHYSNLTALGWGSVRIPS